MYIGTGTYIQTKKKGGVMMLNGMIIDGMDNVGVAIYPIEKGDTISYRGSDGSVISFEAQEDIPIYHKFSVQDIACEEPIVKYGEHIGRAGVFILKGQHVHIHNVVSVRENLE